MQSKLIKKLLKVAEETRGNAWALSSQNEVGASIFTDKHNIYGGCNIESDVRGLSACAERVAINTAIASGDWRVDALLTFDIMQTIPCGACLEYLAEFSKISGRDPSIVTADEDGNYTVYKLSDLLPHRYRKAKPTYYRKED